MGLDLYVRPKAWEDFAHIEDADERDHLYDEVCSDPRSFHAAQWSYGGFHQFRVWLADQESLILDQMQGFEGTAFDDPAKLLPGIPWSSVTSTLTPLLHHSDCDGFLTSEECARISPRLREIVEAASAEEYHKVRGTRLADAVDMVAKSNGELKLVFG